MLLSFEAWRQDTTIVNMFKMAVKLTLKQKQYLYRHETKILCDRIG